MTDFGGQNNEHKASGHTAKDSHLMFKNASAKNFRISLVDNSGAAHNAKNLEFPKECPMELLPGGIQSCSVTLYYHNLAGGDDHALKNYKSFTVKFPLDGTPLLYYIDYSDFGGQNNEDKASGHTAKDSHLVFKDATGKNFRVDLVDNSGSLCKNSPISPQVCDGSNAHPNVPSHCLLPQFGRW